MKKLVLTVSFILFFCLLSNAQEFNKMINLERYAEANAALPDPAEGEKRVLFIDADLRKSVLVGRYKVTGKIKGLTHFLSGQSDAKDVIQKTQDSNLHMIFAGAIPPNPAELLNSRRFQALLASARKLYDYVIIDAPPLGSVIDAAVIAKYCDASVLVVASKTVGHKFAKDVKEQLEKADCPILGVVLNKVSVSNSRYYGKYYGKYTGYYGEYKY